MKKFEQELADLKARVLQMGRLAQSMVAWSTQALVERNPDLIRRVLTSEPQMDRFQIAIDTEAVRLITIYSPAARDLRFLLMVARISTELERVADQTVNTCQYVEHLLSAPPPKPLDDLYKMSGITEGMIRDALRAFELEDTDQARRVLEVDDEVDRLDNQTFRDLLSSGDADPDTINRCMTLILVARSLERIADHATNICEEVIYLVKGEDIRHRT